MTDPLKRLGADNPRYDDHPDFTPDLSPAKVLAAGAFDGAYFVDWKDDQIEGIDPAIIAAGPVREKPDAMKHNAFGIHSGLSLAEWRKKGWIRDQDPVGWFQWYCRFHSGRRTDDDERQIGRWRDFRRRWRPGSPEALANMNPGPKTRQALLHWGIDPWMPEHALGIEVRDGEEKQ